MLALACKNDNDAKPIYRCNFKTKLSIHATCSKKPPHNITDRHSSRVYALRTSVVESLGWASHRNVT